MLDDEMRDVEETKIRVSFILSPSIRNDREALELPSEPIAVPASIRKKGLSAVVNHLLDRDVAKDDGDSSSSDDSGDDEDKLPSIPFDFLINDKLLRLPLDSAARKEGLSLEHALELHYFPARLPPKKEGESESLPDWINCMSYCSAGSIDGLLFTGGADGVIRSFTSRKGELKSSASISAHTAPIKCLSSIQQSDSTKLIATGSMDQTLITHVYDHDSIKLHAVYSGGHTNTISCVALNSDDNVLMASGDWDGGLTLWKTPSGSSDSKNVRVSKKSKGNAGSATDASTNPQEVKPLQAIKAHSSNISGVAFGFQSSTTLLTGSWDHGLKVYDTTRMDCVLAINGSRVVTSLSRCSNSNVVATSSADYTVQLWDMRTSNSDAGDVGRMDKSLRQSHKAWVSCVQWSPTNPFVLASTSHDGSLKVWDIRSSLPLHSVKAVSKKGEKTLCLSFGDGAIYTGGSDCKVQHFVCKI